MYGRSVSDQPVKQETRKGRMLHICFIWGYSIAVMACFIGFAADAMFTIRDRTQDSVAANAVVSQAEDSSPATET